MISRRLAKTLSATKRSLLLLGPRQTGKSTLIGSLNPELTINLARESTYLEYARNPSLLEEQIALSRPKTIFVDEVQRLPSLLNSIQVILDEKGKNAQFYLTGSSARKLRRGGANLLPGRIHQYSLGPLVVSELESKLELTRALSLGTLPGVHFTADLGEARKTLRSYAATYLREEIQAEALVRGLEGFARFLDVAAADAGKFLDLSKLASQAMIPRQSAVRYFEILEDTLIVRRSEAFSSSSRRRLVQHPRYFFFDVGVLNGLLMNFSVSKDRIGNLFEHFIFSQIVHSAQAFDQDIRISSYRTEHGAEVDFIVEKSGSTIALEAKASANVGSADTRGLRSFADFYGKKHLPIIAYLGKTARMLNGIKVLPWRQALREIGY